MIAATNRDLLQEVESHRFREDLYYRLAVITLKMPPLRERKSDIPLLVEAFLSQINPDFRPQEPGYKDKSISAAANGFVRRYPWPGNVRQLYNALVQAAAMTPATASSRPTWRPPSAFRHTPQIDPLDHPLGDGFGMENHLQDIQRHYLRRAMEEAGGVKTRAAELLGIANYQTLDAQLKRLGVKWSKRPAADNADRFPGAATWHASCLTERRMSAPSMPRQMFTDECPASSRFGGLTVKSLNFEFLRPEWPELASLAGFAEQYAHADPAGALVKLRSFAEQVVETVYEKFNLPRPPQARLDGASVQDSFKQAVPRVVVNTIDAIRIHGNKAAHGAEGSTPTVLWLLKETHRLGQWLYLTFTGEPRRTFPPIKSRRRNRQRQVEVRTEAGEGCHPPAACRPGGPDAEASGRPGDGPAGSDPGKSHRGGTPGPPASGPNVRQRPRLQRDGNPAAC